MQMVMTPDETQIQIFANWPMSHAKRVTRDNRKNPEYRVITAIRKLRTDKLSRRTTCGVCMYNLASGVNCCGENVCEKVFCGNNFFAYRGKKTQHRKN